MLILASKSPRRRDLLLREGVSFCVVVREVEEVQSDSLTPEALCSRNARMKADAVAELYPHDTVVGADTLVFLAGKPLGKPKDLAEARAMLTRLQGRTHCVCTAVSIVMPGGAHRDFAELSRVTFRPMSPQDIEHYLGEVYVLDKAGAYAMQEKSELIVASVQGDVDNVIGLPVKRLLRELNQRNH